VTRLRLWFAAVALVSLAAVAALVSRALAVAETERRLRHDAVAERVLDEMERALSELVTAEDARLAQSGVAPTDAEHDFVVSRYRVTPEGTVRSDAPAKSAEVDRLLRAPAAPPPATGPFADSRQSAGTTLSVTPQAAAVEKLEEKKDAKEAFGVLAKLNRGAEARLKAYQPAPAPKANAEGEIQYDVAPGRPAEPGFAQRRVEEEIGAVRSVLRGRALDATHLSLERAAMVAGSVQREGLVIDVPRLFDWLRARGLGDALAGLARVDFAGPVASELPEVQAEFVYRRRFAEPFESLGAQLVLAPLPGIGTAGAIEALGAALVLVLAAGLAVAYRTVATVVGFAQRRAAFAASVSHELKTPLTAIRMYAEMLRDGMVTSEAKRDEYYRSLAVESDRLSRLVNNVLEFSQLEKGARTLALGVAPVEPALRASLDMLRMHVEREGFRLAVDIAPDLPPARFERDALAQIVFNLVDNALKYARDAERREIVVTATRTPNGVGLSVRDFGPGVPREQLGLVFEPFWRGDSELTHRAKGTGIGLALVRRLAEAMGASARAGNAQPTGFEVAIQLAAA
jgi:signal transduction histidine kinase